MVLDFQGCTDHCTHCHGERTFLRCHYLWKLIVNCIHRQCKVRWVFMNRSYTRSVLFPLKYKPRETSSPAEDIKLWLKDKLRRRSKTDD